MNKNVKDDNVSEVTQEDYDRLSSQLQQAIGSSQKYHTYSLRDSIEDSAEIFDSVASKSKPIHDASVKLEDNYGNSLAAIGTNDKVQSFANYGFSNDTLNYTLWLAIYNDSWVFRKAIDKPAQDQVNCGFTLHGDKDYSCIYKTYEKYKTDFISLLKWGALFGGAVAVIMFDGFKAEDYLKPISQQNIKNKKFKLYITDRWYGCAQSTRTVRSMKDIDYGKPYSYEITFASGKAWTVHHSYVLRYEHRNAPRLLKMGYLQGWGYAEGSHILNELARDDQLKSSITSLVNKALIEVIKMKGMRAVFMGIDKGSMTQLEKRLQMVNYGRTYNSLTFLDKDDDYTQYNMTGLSGLSDLMEKNMWLVAAAVDMPGILFGDLKGGLAQESDALQRYAITIKNRCNEYFRPVLNKFIKILFMIYDIDGSPEFDFNSLIKDEENKNKVASIKDLSTMLNDLVTNGIISKYQYALSLRDYVNNDVINLTISDEILDVLKLEEQQVILDGIDAVGKKRHVEVNHPNFTSPYLSRSENAAATESVSVNPSVEENVDIGENINESEETTEQVESVVEQPAEE